MPDFKGRLAVKLAKIKAGRERVPPIQESTVSTEMLPRVPLDRETTPPPQPIPLSPPQTPEE